MAAERLHKILASRGVASRRACEELIIAGRVSVDGRIVRELGLKVEPDADIRVDGAPVRESRKLYFIMNKPRGYLTTLSDELGRKSVGDLLKRLRSRVYPVGRLDAETEGLLLITNDGELTNALTHPRFEVEKTYLVTVKGHMDDLALNRLREGIFLSEGKVSGRIKVLRTTRDSTRLEFTISQGYNRQVRRMCAAVGYEVRRLERVRFGPLRLYGLPKGGFRALTRDEINSLAAYARRAPRASSRPAGRLTHREDTRDQHRPPRRRRSP